MGCNVYILGIFTDVKNFCWELSKTQDFLYIYFKMKSIIIWDILSTGTIIKPIQIQIIYNQLVLIFRWPPQKKIRPLN